MTKQKGEDSSIFMLEKKKKSSNFNYLNREKIEKEMKGGHYSLWEIVQESWQPEWGVM